MNKSIKQAWNFLASAGPYANITVNGNDLNELMMATGGMIMGCGYLYNIQVQQLSGDVFKLSLSPAN